MNTPVLTKRQQRQSLSAKKGPIKGARNVLAQPYTTYWPVLRGDQCTELQNLLKELTPKLKRPTKKIPWSKLRQMSKEERVNAKKSLTVEVNSDNVLNSVVLGVNAVTRALEKNNVCCALLEATVEPQHLIKHIVTMAQNKKVPVLLAPFLKSVMLECIGFSTAAFALKVTVKNSEDHYFYNLYKKISDVSSEFPIPKHSLRLFHDNIQNNDDVSSNQREEISMGIEKEKETTTKHVVTVSTNVYKYRSSRKERAFVPKTKESSTGTCISRENNFGSDFIAMGHESDASDDVIPSSISKNIRYTDMHKESNSLLKNSGKASLQNISAEKKHEKTDASYISLKVKRLQGNSNRTKATKVSKRNRKQ